MLDHFISKQNFKKNTRRNTISSLKIIILGSGFLGSALFDVFRSSGDNVKTIGRGFNSKVYKNVDVQDSHALEMYLKKYKPDVIINTIALSSYYQCELNQSLSFVLNFQLNDRLAKLCRYIGSKLVFISSSYIFNGVSGNYDEDAREYSRSIYSMHKRMAEESIKANLSDYLVVRLETLFGRDQGGAWRVGSTLLRGSVETVDLYLNRRPIKNSDAAIIISELLHRGVSGVYNVAGGSDIEYRDLLRKLIGLSSIPCRILTGDPSSWLIQPPRDTSLNTEKLSQLGIYPPLYSFERSKAK